MPFQSANHPLHQQLTQNPCATQTTVVLPQLPAQEQDLPMCNLPKSKLSYPSLSIHTPNIMYLILMLKTQKNGKQDLRLRLKILT